MNVRKVCCFVICAGVPAAAQINYFNTDRPYQMTLCCPYNVSGLGVELTFALVDADAARLELPVSVYWGIIGNLEIGFRAAGASISRGDESIRGMTDAVLGAKYGLYRENQEQPGPFPTVSVEFCAVVPTGDYRKGFGTGGMGFVFNALLEKRIVLRSGVEFTLFLNGGYRANTANGDGWLFGNETFYGMGGSLPLSERFVSSAGVRGTARNTTLLDGRAVDGTGGTDSYLFAGLSYDFDVYRRFFTAMHFGIDEGSDMVRFTAGMMY